MTIGDRTYRVSPLLFIRPRQHGATVIDVLNRNAFEQLTPHGAELVAFASIPRTVTDLAKNGFSERDVQNAVENGLIMAEDDPCFRSALKWEDANWSRAAYTLFSQFDLRYSEEEWGSSSLEECVKGRRERIRSYMSELPYPDKFWISPANSTISLPWPSCEALDLDIYKLLRRRSVRRFKPDQLSLAVFSTILFGATANVRSAANSQLAGDPLYILNSFYCWLSVFVAVQGVEALKNGFYQYDGELHRLIPFDQQASNKEIAETIANQNWISGGGFCLFIAVDWQRYMWIYRHARAYINLVTQLGEFSQEVIQHATNNDLGAWMTPAVNEKAVAEMLGLDLNRIEPMYFIKIGNPAGQEI